MKVAGPNRHVTALGVSHKAEDIDLRIHRDLDTESPLGATRVLVLGDSYAAGAELPDEELGSGKVEKRLEGDTPDVEIVNAAISRTAA